MDFLRLSALLFYLLWVAAGLVCPHWTLHLLVLIGTVLWMLSCIRRHIRGLLPYGML